MIWLALLGGFLLGWLGSSRNFAAYRALARETFMRERDCYRAARWLAQYNYARMQALEELASSMLSISYYKLSRLIEPQLSRQPYIGAIAQSIPIAHVPAQLQGPARAYNDRMWLHHRDDDAVRLGAETPEQLEVARLRRTVRNLYGLLATVGLEAQADFVISNALGQPDPEEVLPSLY